AMPDAIWRAVLGADREVPHHALYPRRVCRDRAKRHALSAGLSMASVKGGDKLTAKLKELREKIGKGPALAVGFFEGAPHPDGASVPMGAAIQEFGAPKVGIPPRPFFRNMIAKH